MQESGSTLAGDQSDQAEGILPMWPQWTLGLKDWLAKVVEQLAG